MKIVARPDPGNTSAKLLQANPENQKPPTSGNNPPLLEDTPVCVSTPWPEAGKMSGNIFELRRDWPIPPATNTNTNTANATNYNPPVIKVDPQGPEQ